MTAFRIFRRLRELLDVDAASPEDGQVLAYDDGAGKWVNADATGGGGGALPENWAAGDGETAAIATFTAASPEQAQAILEISGSLVDFQVTDTAVSVGVVAGGNATLYGPEGTQLGLDNDGLLIASTGAGRIKADATGLGFFGFGPVAQPAAPSSAQDIADALATLGLLAAGGTIADGVTQGDIDDAIAALVDTAPGTLDTLNELAAALGDDASFASTVTTALGGKQPLDSDLTAIAALTTTSFGRALLALADQAALLSAAGAAAASHAHSGADITSGTVADARIDSAIARDSEVTSAIAALSSVYQPLDSDLTSIAALTTTSYGRAFLGLADAAAARTALTLSASVIPFTPTGTVAATDVQAAIAEVAAEAGGAVETALIVEWFGDLPAAAGNGTVFRVPALDGVSTTFDLLSAFFRLETAGSSTTTVVVEKSAGGGAFSASTVVTLTAASGVYEHTVTTGLGTVTTGNLVRIRWTALGTGAATYLVQLEGEAQ